MRRPMSREVAAETQGQNKCEPQKTLNVVRITLWDKSACVFVLWRSRPREYIPEVQATNHQVSKHTRETRMCVLDCVDSSGSRTRNANYEFTTQLLKLERRGSEWEVVTCSLLRGLNREWMNYGYDIFFR